MNPIIKIGLSALIVLGFLSHIYKLFTTGHVDSYPLYVINMIGMWVVFLWAIEAKGKQI